MGLLNYLAPEREKRNALADALRRKSMADNAPVNALGAPGGLLAMPRPDKPGSALGGLLAASSVVPGIGDFTGPMADAHMYATDPSSRTPGNYAMSLAGLLPFVPSMAGITAFHGSPHLFDSFDMSKIGTGEGAQAYGHGLYFAEAPDVAASYRNPGGPRSGTIPIDVDGTPASRWGQSPNRTKTEARAADAIARTRNPDFAIEYLRQDAERSQEARDAIEWIKTNRAKMSDPGILYTVDIPDEAVAKMLDWDAPLSEQPQMVQQRIYDSMVDAGFDKGLVNHVLNNKTGNELINELAGRLAVRNPSPVSGQTQASEFLKKAGLPGIKYLDQGSRGTGGGTRNFVVFDDKLPKILKRE